MATLAPDRAVGADIFAPLMQIWTTLSSDPDMVKAWYAARYRAYVTGDRVSAYEAVKAEFNARPNGADLLFLSRACYGGVIRFRKKDGYMSTPCGTHPPIKPATFDRRVDIWAQRLAGAQFRNQDFSKTLAEARSGDLVYCDPPYSDSQSILYGAQSFRLERLFEAIADCRRRGIRVALSIDGSKKSGAHDCRIDIPQGLFKREYIVKTGRSMLRRFQMAGQSLEKEQVRDRLLLTW